MNKIEYIATSLVLHIIMFASLPNVLTSVGSNSPIEVSIVEQAKAAPIPGVYLPAPLPKRPLDEGSGGTPKEAKDLILTTYADQIKAVVDPIYYTLVIKKLEELRAQGSVTLTTEITVIIDKTGDIKSTRITKSCGDANLDAYATRTFRSISTLPAPPKEIILNGRTELIWTFTLQ